MTAYRLSLGRKARHARSTRRKQGSAPSGTWRRPWSLGTFEQLEPRAMLSGGVIELGPSDNVALDQPRVAIELIADIGAAAYRYDFGTETSLAQAGFIRATTAVFDGTVGWQPETPAPVLQGIDRAVGSDLNRDFVSISTAQAIFSRTLANGIYQVQVHLGDLASPHDDMAVWFEGETSAAHPWVDTAAGQVLVKTYTVEVGDNRLDVHLQDMGGVDDQVTLVGLEIVNLDSGWASVGPDVFNTFLLDTGANSVLAMASAVEDMEAPPVGYETDGLFREVGVAGYHDMDISAAYRFDFAGTSGSRHTVLDTRIQSDASNDFSIFGPWGLAGMPAMAGRVTTLDMTGWSGGEVGLDDLYMKVRFSEDMAEEDLYSGAGGDHRYALSVDNRLAFDPMDYMVDPVNDEPPVWADIPFLTAIPTQNGVGSEGNFLFDTGAQISVISKRLAIQIGLDSNGDGELDQDDDSYVTTESVGGVGGTVPAPVFSIDEVHVPVRKVLAGGALGEEVELVWTNLQWLVLDIETDEATTLDGVFGSDLLTSGWFHAFFYGLEDGYFDRVHFDFQDWGLYNGTPESREGTVYFDINPLKDQVTQPGPGVRIRHSGGTTQVAENGGTDTYTVVLTGEPTADVTIRLATTGTPPQVTAVHQADLSDTLVFTASNWNVPQTVVVEGLDDAVAEGPHTDAITHTVTSGDTAYNNMSVGNVDVSVVDDDLSLIRITSDQAGLNEISEIHVAEGEPQATYWVSLESPPSSPANYVFVEFSALGGEVTLTNDDTGPFDLTDALTFTTDDWQTPKAINVAPINDQDAEGPHQTQIAHMVIELDMTTFQYVGLGQTTLPVNITDDDLGHVTITETIQSTLVVEGEDTDTYQIALDLAPAGPVEITVTAGSQLEVSDDGGSSFHGSLVLSFTDTTPQTITVRAFDDPVEEGAHTGRITHAITGTVADLKYPTSLPIQSVNATILDNDAAGVRITADAAGQNVVTSVAAVEGAEVNYWVALNSQPTQLATQPQQLAAQLMQLDNEVQQNVIIYFDSSNPQVSIVDAATPGNAFLTFTAENWSTPQAIRVIALDDGIPEGTQTAQVTLNTFSSDPQYQGSAVSAMTLSDPATIVDRRIFYNNSYFDGNSPLPGSGDDGAIAPSPNEASDPALGKKALLPGETATFQNYTSYSKGINGIILDIAGLPAAAILTLNDFLFRVGNSNTPSDWAVAPDPILVEGQIPIRRGAGVNGSDRVTLIWADDNPNTPAREAGSISKQWLQVTVLAGADTGLAADDVFYFGNAIGESGNGNTASLALVNATDSLGARYNKHLPPNFATITDEYDFNRDRLVNATDELVARYNYTSPATALKMIAVPGNVSGEMTVSASQSWTAPQPETPASTAGPARVASPPSELLGGGMFLANVFDLSVAPTSARQRAEIVTRVLPDVAGAMQPGDANRSHFFNSAADLAVTYKDVAPAAPLRTNTVATRDRSRTSAIDQVMREKEAGTSDSFDWVAVSISELAQHSSEQKKGVAVVQREVDFGPTATKGWWTG